MYPELGKIVWFSSLLAKFILITLCPFDIIHMREYIKFIDKLINCQIR